MAKKDRKQEKQNKKPSHGLFAALFAPLDELEDDGIDYDTEFDDEEALDEDGELIHLFDDDEVEFSEEEDFEADFGLNLWLKIIKHDSTIWSVNFLTECE